MEAIQVEQLLKDFGPNIKHYSINDIGGIPEGDWFSFEASPLAPPDELLTVIADIGREVTVNVTPDGMVRHSIGCTYHKHKISPDLDRAIKKLTPKTYKFIVWEGNGSVLFGQPVVIPIEPNISYQIYPDHPHLNVGGFRVQNFAMPDTICYTDDPQSLGNDNYTRVRQAILQSCIWLLRHEVWLVTRKNNNAEWIGIQCEPLERYKLAPHLSPFNPCHCGCGLEYRQCHLKRDMAKYPSLIPGKYNIDFHIRDWWPKNVDIPMKESMNRLKSII